ncbi:methylamine utilization protein MauJ [Bradyrhizobium sp. 76]|uniref:methylamine utilization protein MauJ n=1 Tax=Bradyrhizobium sp. 76 TaxID=2782680 RepID=UPI001FF7AFA0|nr:methylamine utilization protein MauJ [Bradyrhizobium sp. 76]MCK1407878.1 hypothetical protein [Bradyrhizobium sp. 76]
MDELLMLARRLYARRQAGIVAPTRWSIQIIKNSPVTTTLAHGHETILAAKSFMVGWCFDHERTSLGLVPLVNFNPHSINIETDDSERYDVTPSRASQRYPSLDHEGYRDQPEAITAELLESVKELQRSPSSVAVDRALRWYSAGVGSALMEDQFQYFWFVLELIAETTTDKRVVADKCQKCRSDLICPSCDEVSTHRPFQKQRIEALLTRLKISSQIQGDLFDIRNGLMHGRAREQIEESIQEREPDFEFAKAVDFAGRTAFMAIFNAFGIKQSQLDRLVFAAPETFVSRAMVMKAHLIIGMHGDPADPQLKDVVLPTITAHRIDESGNISESL